MNQGVEVGLNRLEMGSLPLNKQDYLVKYSPILTGMLLLISTIYFAVDYLYHSELFLSSCYWIMELHSIREFRYYNVVINLFNIFSWTGMKIYCIIVAMFRRDKYLAALQIIGLYFSFPIPEILKIIFYEGRPSYMCPENAIEITSYHCSGTLGMPASHEFSAVFLFLMVVHFEILHQPLFKSSRFWKIFAVVFIGVFSLSIVYVFFVLLVTSAHTFSQNMYGLLIGFIAFDIYYQYFLPWALKTGSRSFDKRKALFALALATAGVNLFAMLVTFIRTMTPVPEEWLANLLNYCHWINNGAGFQVMSLYTTAPINVALALGFCIVFHEGIPRKVQSISKFLTHGWIILMGVGITLIFIEVEEYHWGNLWSNYIVLAAIYFFYGLLFYFLLQKNPERTHLASI